MEEANVGVSRALSFHKNSDTGGPVGGGTAQLWRNQLCCVFYWEDILQIILDCWFLGEEERKANPWGECLHVCCL